VLQTVSELLAKFRNAGSSKARIEARMTQFVVERVDCPIKLDQIFGLRPRAWKSRVASFPDMTSWSDPFDAEGLHWAVFANQTPIAAARLTIHERLSQVPNHEVFAPVLPADLPGPIAVLTRLVVDRAHAGQGLSSLLDQARIEHARAAGCRWIIGSTFAGQKRLDQMVACGFRILGEAGAYQSGPLQIVGGGGIRETAFIMPTA
jgi:GNAT superfamily N-acetyltransferase